MKRSLAAAAVFLPQVLMAQELASINVDHHRLIVGEELRLNVELRSPGLVWCGLRVSFGDGEARDIRVEKPSQTLAKRYAAPGTYTINVDGVTLLRGLMTYWPCRGQAQSTTITVAETAPVKLLPTQPVPKPAVAPPSSVPITDTPPPTPPASTEPKPQKRVDKSLKVF